MSRAAEIATGYPLPFAVRYTPGALESGADLVLEWQVAPSRPHDLVAMRDALRAFSGLAAIGALGGPRIAPAQSGCELVLEGLPEGRVRLRRCRLDERALVVLAHVLLARAAELNLASLRLSADERGGRTIEVLAEAAEDPTFPGPPAPLPFELLDEEPESGAVTFTAELAENVRPETEAALIEAAERWRVGVCAGGYGLAPFPPEGSYVEPDEPVAFGSTLEWTVSKLRADDGALDAAVNMFAALHVRAQRIVSLKIAP